MLSVKTTVGVLLLLTALILVPMAYATPTQGGKVSGKFTATSFMVTSIQFVGGNTIISWNATAVSFGGISGNYVTTAVEIDHPDGSGSVTEIASLTGSVLGRAGTFVGIGSNTWGSDGLCNPKGLCKGVITEGTGGLLGIHGVTYYGQSPFGNNTMLYSGRVHFSLKD